MIYYVEHQGRIFQYRPGGLLLGLLLQWFTTGITTAVVVPVVNQQGGIEKFSPRAEFSIP